MKSLAALASAAVLLLAAACGPPTNGQGPADGGTDGGTHGGFQVAYHAPYPQVVNHGGGVLAHPRLATITFAGYAFTSQVKAFGTNVVTSKWLKAGGKPYGVGTGTYVGNFEFPTSPSTASNTGTASFIEQHIKAGDLPSAAAGEAPILYMVFYPAGVPISLGYKGSASCSTFAGFHDEAQYSTGKFPYAVIPRCSGSFANWDYIEPTASHELIEASTDPWVHTGNGWYLGDPKDPWSSLGGEVGDLCVDLNVQEGNDIYQRTWSNSAAKAGNANPCVPDVNQPSFGITTNDTRIITGTAGHNLTIPIRAWTSGTMDPFSLQVFTWSEDFPGQPMLSATSVNNGDIADLQVTVPASTPHSSQALYLVIATTANGGASFWPVVIQVP